MFFVRFHIGKRRSTATLYSYLHRNEQKPLMKGRLLSINRYFQGHAGCYKKTHLSSSFLVRFADDIATMNGIEKRDIIPLHAIRFRPMQELKMEDFPGGCTNPLKCHGTLSRTSLNKSYFYLGVRSHYLYAFLQLPKLLVGITS